MGIQTLYTATLLCLRKTLLRSWNVALRKWVIKFGIFLLKTGCSFNSLKIGDVLQYKTKTLCAIWDNCSYFLVVKGVWKEFSGIIALMVGGLISGTPMISTMKGPGIWLPAVPSTTPCMHELLCLFKHFADYWGTPYDQTLMPQPKTWKTSSITYALK